MKEVKIQLGDAIGIDKDIFSGNPCVYGSRIPVSQLLATLADGNITLKEFCDDFDVDFKQFKDAL